MGSVHVHDRRPRWDQNRKDEWGYGELLMSARSRRPLKLGEPVTLPDGTCWPVVSTREFHSLFGWRQHVVVGLDQADVSSLERADLDLAS